MSEVFPVVKSYSISPVSEIFTLHGGYCTFACITKKLCSYIFQGLCWSACYSIILSLEKEIIVLEKSLEKSWILDPKIYTNPTLTVLTLRRERTTKNINQMSVVTPSVYITLPSLCDASVAHYFICKLQLAPTSIRTKYSQCCKLSLKSPNCR